MGQDSSHHKIIIPASLTYEIDPRLIDFTIELPSSFAYSYQRFIEDIQACLAKVPEHELGSYMVHSINQRFNRYVSVDQQTFHKEKSIYEYLKIDHQLFSDDQWDDLRTKGNFRKLMRKFNQQYHYQLTFSQLFSKEQDVNDSIIVLHNNIVSLRKPLHQRHSNNDDFMDEGLMKYLFYRYYINVFKSYASNNKQKEALVRFHQEVGWLLCKIVSAGDFSAQQLFQLAYCAIYLDKTGLKPINQLQFLRRKHLRYCLEKKHSVGMDLRKLGIISRATRLYLDELYLCSMKQAQDPQIHPDSDSLIPIKTFPVQRARQRTGR